MILKQSETCEINLLLNMAFSVRCMVTGGSRINT